MSEGIRIDKWLWAVRLVKTRSIATDLCKRGKVFVDGSPAKPSKQLQIGDEIVIKKPPVLYSYKVIGLIGKRVSATLAAEHVTNTTPPEELEKLKSLQESAFFARDKGIGRPTKKDRRDLDKFQM